MNDDIALQLMAEFSFTSPSEHQLISAAAKSNLHRTTSISFPIMISESFTPPTTTEAPKPKKTKRGPRGGVYDPFPMKVHRMLHQSRLEGQETIVSWLPHGRAFKIHQPKVFAEVIMPRFFNQSKYTSFQRQLNLYGEER
jgi:hypothetical protein